MKDFNKKCFIPLLVASLFICCTCTYAEPNGVFESSGLYTIEGRVFPPTDCLGGECNNWQASTRIHVNGGEYVGFLQKDGTFTIYNVPSDSYIVEILHPEYSFESIRVDINSKGKYRARKLSYIQTPQIAQVPYPLKIKTIGKTRYFQVREQWRLTDFLFNPMVMMMVLPLVFIMILPKMMNDPETKREMEQIQGLTKFEMPEMSDMVSNFLAGNSGSQYSQTQGTKKVQKTRRRIDK